MGRNNNKVMFFPFTGIFRRKDFMETKKRMNSFLLQGGILAIAGILVRIIGMAYRIPLTKVIGNIGNNYYGTAYEIYSMILLVSSYSIPLALSKEMSTKIALRQYRNARKVFHGAMFYAVIVGILGSVGAFLLAPTLGEESAVSLRVLSPTILFSAILGVFRGYFQGHRTMLPTSFSQILEQIANAFGSVLLAYVFTRPYYLSGNMEGVYTYGAAGSAVGTEIGVLVALLFMIVVFIMYRPRVKKMIKKDVSGVNDSYGQIMRIIILTLTPVIFSTFIYNISGTIDVYFYKNINAMIGMNETSTKEFWGIFSGQYKTLIAVPIALASAISSAMIPAITTAVAKGERKDLNRRVDMAFKFTLILAIPATFGLMSLAEPILRMLFSSNYTDTSSKLFIYGGINIIFYCISTISNSVLQSIGQLKLPVRHSAISLGIHVLVLVPLLYYGRLHVYAVVGATLVFTVSMCLLNAIALKKYLNYRMSLRKILLIPILCSSIMAVCAFGFYKLSYMIIKSNVICTLLSICVAGMIYFVTMLILKGITEAELKKFPKGTLIIKVAKKMKLM